MNICGTFDLHGLSWVNQTLQTLTVKPAVVDLLSGIIFQFALANSPNIAS